MNNNNHRDDDLKFLEKMAGPLVGKPGESILSYLDN